MDQLDEDIVAIREKIVRLRLAYQAATDLDERVQLVNELNGAIAAHISLIDQRIARANERQRAAQAMGDQDNTLH